MKRILTWISWSPRRAALIAAAVLAVVLVAVPLSCSRRGETADAGPAGGVGTCGQAAEAWATVFASAGGSDEQWRANLAALTAPQARDLIGSIPRDAVPTGAVTGVQWTAQPGSCDATATIGGGQRIALVLAPESSRWLVTEWAPS